MVAEEILGNGEGMFPVGLGRGEGETVRGRHGGAGDREVGKRLQEQEDKGRGGQR